jgi:hypothetical protein
MTAPVFDSTPTSNAAGRDASAVECRRNYVRDHLVGMPMMTPGPNADDKIVAHWEDAQYAITLFRSRYMSTFGLVLLSKRLDAIRDNFTDDFLRWRRRPRSAG